MDNWIWVNINESKDNLKAKTAVELIDYLTINHHEYVKVELPRITKLSYTIRRVHGNTHPELHLVEKTFKDLAELIEEYMGEEENRFFPNIRGYEKINSDNSLKIMEIVANNLKNKQLRITEGFKVLRELTNNNIAPDDGCQTFDLTYELYTDIEEVLKNQFHVENKYLFPKLI